MTHSPFPWSTHPQVPNAVFDADGNRIVWDAPAVAEAEASPPLPPIDPETAADNAALIAAIPAMVAALENIATRKIVRYGDYLRCKTCGYKSVTPHTEERHAPDCAREKARAVLASIGKKP